MCSQEIGGTVVDNRLNSQWIQCRRQWNYFSGVTLMALFFSKTILIGWSLLL